jgi:hypothetical protein
MSVRVATGGSVDWALGSGTSYANIPDVRKWTLRVTNDSKTYASSSTAGGKQRLAGAEDFSGSVDFYANAGTNRIETATLLGIKGGVTGTLKLKEDGVSANVWLAPAYIEDVSIDADIEGNNIISGTFTFSRNGALTYPT